MSNYIYNKTMLSCIVTSVALILPVFLSAQIDITNISGTWTSVQGGANVTGLGTNSVYWGATYTPTSLKSGYGFTAAPNIYNVEPGSSFLLGTFTHYNQDIPANTAITKATLNTQLLLAVDSTPAAFYNFQYVFLHNETPNVAGQCPAGSVSICDDIVTIENNDARVNNVVINGQTYHLTIQGFQVNGGKTLSQFLTPEDATSSAQLIGSLSLVVPEPATYLVLGSLACILVGLKKRKKRIAQLRHA
jgi:hypothetical protein